MGLDINAYKGLRKVENPKFESDGELENWEKAFAMAAENGAVEFC